MSRRERSALKVTCDAPGCGHARNDTGYRSHKVFWDEAKSAGWIAKPINDGKDWQHFCPDCFQRYSSKE